MVRTTHTVVHKWLQDMSRTRGTRTSPFGHSEFCHLGRHPELSSFSKEYTEYAGEEGQWSPQVTFKMLIMQFDMCHFQSTLLGGGHKKEYSVNAFDNIDNSG